MKSKKRPNIPSYRHHAASGQGYVEFNGRRHYLGRYDLPETRESYHRLIAEWLSHGRQLPVATDEITIVEILARFMAHAEEYYRRPDGTATTRLSET